MIDLNTIYKVLRTNIKLYYKAKFKKLFKW
jgi:hypothetical protein